MTKKEHGSLLSAETTCAADHIVVWHSQPTHGRGYTLGGCGTWLIAAAILFCGGSFQTFALFATLLNLAFVGERSYFDTQKSLLCPVVHKAWQDHVASIREYFRGKEVKVCGDARCDSPGYSAKYGKLFLSGLCVCVRAHVHVVVQSFYFIAGSSGITSCTQVCQQCIQDLHVPLLVQI